MPLLNALRLTLLKLGYPESDLSDGSTWPSIFTPESFGVTWGFWGGFAKLHALSKQLKFGVFVILVNRRGMPTTPEVFNIFED